MRNLFLIATAFLATNISAEIEPIDELLCIFEEIPTVPVVPVVEEVEKPVEEVVAEAEPERLPALEVERVVPSDVIFITVRSSRKEPMVETEEEMLIKEQEFVSIAEVGPFSPFTIIRKTVKKPIEEELMAVTRTEPQLIHFPQSENLPVGFYLSPTHVTNGEYEVFVRATHHRPPPHWFDGKIPTGQEDDPVVNVTYKDAFLYAIWSGKRLPKESELSYAFNNSELFGDAQVLINEWTSTPSLSSNRAQNNKSTINSELCRITYHKVFTGEEPTILESNYYSNNLGFRVAQNSY